MIYVHMHTDNANNFNHNILVIFLTSLFRCQRNASLYCSLAAIYLLA